MCKVMQFGGYQFDMDRIESAKNTLIDMRDISGFVENCVSSRINIDSKDGIVAWVFDDQE